MWDSLIGLILLGLGVHPNVKGESSEIRQDNAEILRDTREIRQDKREIRRDVRSGDLKETREDTSELREDRSEHTEDIRALDKDREENLRRLFKEKREELRENIAKERQEAKEEFRVRRQEFREKLAEIRDEKKKEILEHLDRRINEINTHRVDQMTKHLNKISEVLEKVVGRAADAKANGKDTSAVDAAATIAQAAISAAQSCLTTQAGKQYVIELTTEENAKTDVGAMHRQLRSDLTVCHQLVVAARQSVRTTIQALAHVLGSSAPNISPTTVPTIAVPEETPTVVPTGEEE